MDTFIMNKMLLKHIQETNNDIKIIILILYLLVDN
jgi:hypothetical protein